jgi:hypothetical protein
MRKTRLHYVVGKRAPKAPPLPKEVMPVGPREYVDRFGEKYRVVDPPQVSPYLTRSGDRS